MTSLLSARRRAEEFAAAVEAPADQQASPALAGLVDLVGALRTQEPPAPRAEFTASLRERLMAEADQILVQDAALTLPRRRTGARERRLAIAASSFVLVGGSAGLAAAAQSSLPGDALYPIKRGIETAQAGLSTNQAAKGRDLLGQADSRLTEVRGLVAEDSGTLDQTQVPDTIRAFAKQADEGSRLLLESYGQDRDPATVVEVRTFAANSLGVLQDLAKDAPPEEQTALTGAAQVLQRIDRDATQQCSNCGSGRPALQLPPTFLAAAEVNRAIEALKGAHVDNAHPPLIDGTPTAPRGDGKPKGDGAGKGSNGGTKGDGNTKGGGTDSGNGPGGLGLPGLPQGGGSGDGLGGKLGGLGGKLGSKNGDTGTTKKVLPDPVDQIVKSLLP